MLFRRREKTAEELASERALAEIQLAREAAEKAALINADFLSAFLKDMKRRGTNRND